jgi:predicted RNase H-like HicB family nuclease
MVTQTLTAVLHQEDRFWIAECPEVGTVSQGESLDEALANLKEATGLYLEEFPQSVGARTILTTFEVAHG